MKKDSSIAKRFSNELIDINLIVTRQNLPDKIFPRQNLPNKSSLLKNLPDKISPLKNLIDYRQKYIDFIRKRIDG